jgi:hypothetical protein
MIILLAGLALTAGLLWNKDRTPTANSTPETPSTSISEKLNRIIIPDYPTKGVSLAEAVEHLRGKTREFDSTTPETSEKGINIVIIAGGDTPLTGHSDLPLRDVPLGEALRHITGLAGMRFVVEPHAVAIRELDDQRGPSIKPSTNMLQLKMEKIILPTVQFHDATIEEATEYLRVSRGCLDADDHSSSTIVQNYVLKLHANDKRPHVSLDLKGIPLGEALRYCAEITGTRLRYEPHAVVITDDDTILAGTSMAKNERASLIILPVVALSGATLDEAVEFIRLKSRELDREHKGIDIVVRPGALTSSIELDLKQIPITEALRYIAELSGHRLTCEDEVFRLTPDESH